MDELGIIAKIGAGGAGHGTPQGVSVALKVLDRNLRATSLVGLTLLRKDHHGSFTAPY